MLELARHLGFSREAVEGAPDLVRVRLVLPIVRH